MAFILICGISCALSRNNFLRGTKILGAALCVTLVSLFIMPDMPIVFGILHLLGTCVLIYSFAGKITDRLPPLLGIIICFLLFVMTYNVSDLQYVGIGDFRINLPFSLYKSNDLMALGFIAPSKSYSDYFPLLPWIFSFFAGTYIGKYAKDGRFPECMYKSRIKPLSTLGKNAFFVYLIHQPLAYAMALIYACVFISICFFVGFLLNKFGNKNLKNSLNFTFENL